MKNDGTTSEGIFQQAVERNHGIRAYLYRLADQKEVSRGKALKVQMRQTPSDFIYTRDGQMAYAEVKSCSNPSSFPFSQFTPGQNLAMVRQDKAGGAYLVFIHSLTTDEWFRVPGSIILFTRAKGKKSMTWAELKEFKIQLKDM